MYSTINVNKGNKILKRMEVSFPILVIPRMKNAINPKVSACKIPKIQKMLFLFCIMLNYLFKYIKFVLGAKIKLNITAGLREVSFQSGTNEVSDLVKLIWVKTCKVFLLNRCYTFFLQEKKPKAQLNFHDK